MEIKPLDVAVNDTITSIEKLNESIAKHIPLAVLQKDNLYSAMLLEGPSFSSLLREVKRDLEETK